MASNHFISPFLEADVHILFIKNGEKILLLRRWHTGFEDGKYSLVAGRRQDNEPIADTAIREAKEEMGVNIPRKDLELIHVMQLKDKPDRVEFFFLAKSWTGKPANKEGHKCNNWGWFSINQLPHDTIPYIKYALAQYQQKTFYSEFNPEQTKHKTGGFARRKDKTNPQRPLDTAAPLLFSTTLRISNVSVGHLLGTLVSIAQKCASSLVSRAHRWTLHDLPRAMTRLSQPAHETLDP